MPKYSNASSRINLDVGFNVDKSSLQEIKSSLQQLQKLNLGNFAGPQKELLKVQDQARKVEKALTEAFNPKLNTINLEKFNAYLTKEKLTIQDIASSFVKAGAAGQTAFNRLATSILTTNLQLKETHSLIQNFGTTMLNTIKWGFASSIINNFTGSIQQAVSYVEGLDKSLTNIRIVTGDSREEMAKFAEEANRASQSLGRSTMDYTKAALSYYQQGLSDEDVAARTEATLKAQNITGAGQEMADYLTAVWNGYKVVNEEAELYVDKMAAVADSSASNMAQLATAMSKVASTANMMGVDMDQLNAQIATIVATTRQAPESVGNALKTIYTRINDIKTGSDDAQISLGNYTSKMAQLGVNVLDASGNLRDTGEVIEQIGGKWDTMSREQQIYLSRTMAGQRQINNLLALFDNWSRYSDLVNISMQSQGTTMEKNSRYMESLAAHLNQLNAAQQRLKSSMIDSDSFKGLVDFGTGAVTVFANLIEAIGGGGTAILGLGGIFTNVFSGIISRQITNVVTHFQTLKSNAEQLKQDINFTQAFGSLEGFSDKAVNKMVAAKEAAQQFYSVLSEGQINSYQGMVKEVGQLQSEIDKYQNLLELALAVERQQDLDQSVVFNEQEFENFENFRNYLAEDFVLDVQINTKNFEKAETQLLNTAENLKTALGDQVWNGLDSVKRLQNIKLDGTTGSLRAVKVELENIAREASSKDISPEQINKIKGTIELLNGKLGQAESKLSQFQKEAAQLNKVDAFVKLTGGIMSITSAISMTVNAFKALKNESLSTGEKILQVVMGLASAAGMAANAYTQLGPVIVKVASAIASENGLKLGGITISTASTAARTAETGATLGLAGATQVLTGATIEFETAILPLLPVLIGIGVAVAGIVAISKLLYNAWTKDARAAQQAAQNAAAASQAYDKVKESADQLKSSLEEYNSFQDTLASLTRGTEEWNQAIQQSNELVLDLINKFPELAEQVKNVNGQLVLDQDAIETVQQNMNKQVQAASLNKAYAAAVSRDASITSQATDLGRQFSRQASNINATPVNISGQQMKIIAQELNKFEAGQLEDIGIDQLNDHLATEAQVSLDVIEAIRNEETGIKQLQNAIRQNTNATKLQYQALVANSEELQKDSTYQAANDEQKQLIQSLTTSSLQTAIKDIENTWQGTLSDLSKFNDARNQQWSQTILDAVSAAEGQTVRWDTNSIRGRGQNMQFVLQGEDGKQITYRKEQIASLLASKEALDGLSDSVSNATDILNTLNKYEFSSDNTKEQNQAIRAAIEGYIANQNFDNVSKDTLEQLTSLDLNEIFSKEEIKDIASAVGVTTGEITEDFQDLANSTIDSFGKAFDQLPDALAEKARGAFENADLTTGAEKAIVQNLHNAIAEGGKQGYEDLLYSYSKISDIQAFEDLASQLDFSTISADQFGDKLEKAGIETNLTNKQLQKYIELKREQGSLEAAQATYKDVHAITDELQTGDIIAPEDVEVLRSAGINLDKFFITTAQGGLKLVSSANQFKNAVNEITLENFRTEIAKTRELIANANTFREQHSFEDLSTYSRKQADVGDKLEFLSYTDVDPEQIANWQLLNEQQNLTNKQYRQINDLVKENQTVYENWEETISGTIERQKQQEEALASTAQTISQLNDMLAQGDIDENVYSSMLKQTSDTQMSNLGFDVDEYEDYVAILQATNEEAEKNEAIARQMAKTQMRVSQGMEQLIDNWQDWNDVLLDFQQTGDLSNLAENWGDISQGLANLFDTDTQAIDMLGPNFVANNLDKIQNVKNGVQGAYQQLSSLMSQELLLRAYGVSDFSQLDKDIQDAYNMIQDVSNDATIQVGAVFNGQDDLVDAFNRIVQNANWTSAQAQAAFSQMGYDVEVESTDPKTQTATEENQYYIPPVYKQMTTPYTLGPFGPEGVATWLAIATPGHYQSAPGGIKQTYEPGHYAIKTVTKNGKSSGGKISRRKASASTPRKSSGGGKSGGGSGSTPKAASQAKVNTSKIETKTKTAQTNPYQQQQKAFQRQEKILDNLQNKQKKLVNKDRLKNLKDQNKTLEEQVKILNKELDISKNQAAENSTANYAKRLKDAFGSVLRFDSDGQISDINALEKASVNTYNRAAKAAADAFEKQKAKYNDYITNTWNKYSTQEQQEANKTEKEYWDQRVKNAEEAAKKAISAAQEEYKTREDLIKSYNSAWEADQDRLEKIRDLQDQIIENRIAISKITVDLSIDTGQAERDWLEFEKKFIKKIDNDDFLGQAKASVKELMSYFNSKQVQQTANQIKKIQNQIAVMEKGAVSSIYGDNLAQAKEDLEDYMKQQMSDLQDVQDLVDDIKDNYLDAIDSAKDKMDQQIDQYERVNDLVEHNVKLTELLYGDKAYATMDKYYDLIQKNNEKELDSLRKQQEYWQERMNQQVVGSDAWQHFKKNLDDATDSLNDKLEEMIDNSTKKWQNRVDGIIEKLNNGLTNNRGLDYIDEQWDYINNFDDNFLDTVNSVMGTRDVERLYQQAIDNAADSPKQQQRINKLMNEQLKILKEKNKLTEYDIERAKALLQVEQARMALEDARNAKTKMRLRRDSQGNYTYQYVADEQKLSELQAALDDAQTNLYNQDKEHYKQNLNELYDTYKDYIDKMRQLTQEYNQTQDEEERARIQARMDLLKQSTNQLMQGLTQDNEYALRYLNQSFFDAMQIDASNFTAEQQMENMNQNIPQMKSNIQDLANQIVGQGGILNATADAMAQINKATQKYDADVKNMLENAGTSLQIVSQAVDGSGNALDKNIQNAEKFITANDKLIEACDAQIKEIQLLMDWLDKYLNKVMNVESLVANLRNAYGADQRLNGSNLTADNISVENVNLDTTAGMEYTGNPATDAAKVKSQIDLLLAQYEEFLKNMTIATFDTGGATGTWADAQGRLAFLHQKELVLNATDTENILRAVDMVRNMTNSLSSFANSELNDMMTQAVGMLGGINTNSTLDQNVHIEASFPNVREHTEIEQAFENLVNMASMHASGYRD